MRSESRHSNPGTEKHCKDMKEREACRGQAYIDTGLCKRENILGVIRCTLYIRDIVKGRFKRPDGARFSKALNHSE